jgi:hypothetical protein
MTSWLHHLRDRLHTKLLTLLSAPTPTYPTINSRGQPGSGVSAETIQVLFLVQLLRERRFAGQFTVNW